MKVKSLFITHSSFCVGNVLHYTPSAGSLGAREPSAVVRSPDELAADDWVSLSGAVPSSSASCVVIRGWSSGDSGVIASVGLVRLVHAVVIEVIGHVVV